MGKAIVTKELTRTQAPEMQSSQTSFFSNNEPAVTDPEQQEKLKRLTKPFAVSTRKSKEGFLREQDIDDMLSEISTPDINYSERKRIMEALEKREKLKEEAEL